jgi:hypothetical protein
MSALRIRASSSSTRTLSVDATGWSELAEISVD